jgi:voltage-gated potassium channel
MIKGYLKNFLNNKFVDYFLIFLIIFNIICLGFETDKTIYLTYKTFFSKVELVSVIIFTIEYIMRLVTLDKLKNIFQPLMVIDLLAILPFYLPLSRLDLRILRIFRLFRILRIFKLARYFEALQMIGKVIYKKRTELISIFGVLLFLIFLSSFFMFYAEAEAQPNAFHNILDTFWWSIVTFTTVGYGDVYPITPIGKLLSATIVLIGIMLFALPTSILTAEFLNEFQSKDK